jgi:molecular chaperone GrpE
VTDRAADAEDMLAAAPGIGAELELGEDEDADEQAEPDEAADADEQAEPDYLGDLQRVSAEFANFRKQTEKRNLDLMARASHRLAEALLPVLDACDAAALQGIEGVEQIQSQLMSVLGSEGLEVIADTDEPFDPNRHDAVMTEPADEGDEGDEGTVVAEMLRTGYAWKGRVIRPAMVKVRG